LPEWKVASVLRQVTLRRVRQLKRSFIPVDRKVETLNEGVDEMRKALFFVQNQLPREQLTALSSVHSNLDARLDGVEARLRALSTTARRPTRAAENIESR